jgi:DNA polymerase-3 subunit epsilon
MGIQELDSQSGTHPLLGLNPCEAVYVAFDTETTGLSPVGARLVELSGVKFLADGTEISRFQTLIDPQCPIPPEATAIHGITDDMVAGQPTYAEAVPAFFDFALAADVQLPAQGPNQTVLVAHNAPFDLGFLEVAMGKLALPAPANLVLDTLPLSRALIPESPNYQLATLINHLGIEASTYHRALADSCHVMHLFSRMIDLLEDGATLETLVMLSGKLQFMDRTREDAESQWTEHPEYVAIKKAIDGKMDLRIQYSGARTSQRVVTPLSVLFTGGVPYLSAFCHTASAERTFRIDRIVRMETLGKDHE